VIKQSPLHIPPVLAQSRELGLPDRGSLKEDLKILEKQLIERALRVHPHGRQALAEYLGISKRALMYKLKEHGLV
jgi:transcriptional regulator with PAS, ATPase and Fis domain